MLHKLQQPRVLKATGYVLVGAAILGLISNIAGLFVVAVVQWRAEAALESAMDAVDQLLAATGDGLVVADQSLAQVGATLGATEATLRTSVTAVGNSVPALESLNETLGTEVPEILNATQTALGSAQTSATAVDDILGGLSGLPFLGGLARYAPETPLGESIGQVNSSLDGLPDSVAALSDGLDAATDSARAIQGDLGEIAENLAAIDASIGDAREVVAQYQQVVERMQRQAAMVRTRAPVWLSLTRWGVSFMLLWLAIAQLAIFTQGVELIERGERGAAG